MWNSNKESEPLQNKINLTTWVIACLSWSTIWNSRKNLRSWVAVVHATISRATNPRTRACSRREQSKNIIFDLFTIAFIFLPIKRLFIRSFDVQNLQSAALPAHNQAFTNRLQSPQWICHVMRVYRMICSDIPNFDRFVGRAREEDMRGWVMRFYAIYALCVPRKCLYLFQSR